VSDTIVLWGVSPPKWVPDLHFSIPEICLSSASSEIHSYYRIVISGPPRDEFGKPFALYIGREVKEEGHMDSRDNMQNEQPTLRIVPIASDVISEDRKKTFLELQLQMATSSINHEYALREFDDVDDHSRREELLEYMNDCRIKYFEARESLERVDPHGLIDFEKDLISQKMQTMTEYNA
jgi:hypothetical protein